MEVKKELDKVYLSIKEVIKLIYGLKIFVHYNV